jgi:hypothetical protein
MTDEASIDEQPTPPSAAQVKRYARDGELFYEVDANGNWLQTEMYVTGQTEPVMARRVAFMDSRVRPVVYASDFDTLALQMDVLTAERDALKARVEALEFAMQTAINEIHYDDNSAAAERTLRKALAGDRP